MSNYQTHFGRTFYQCKKTGYWLSTSYGKDKPRVRAHQWVWICTHGKIPPGYHIHHRNNDKSDNRIENLELIYKSTHLSYHLNDPIRKEQSRKICDKIRPLSKKWHASEQGRAWHKAHGILTWINRKPEKRICKICVKEYETKTFHQEFCSNKCKSKWRRDSGLDNIERQCSKCLCKFMINKYTKTKKCRECNKR